jgi:hypothetical protein
MTIRYIKGIKNTLANHLSRPETLREYKFPVTLLLRPDNLKAEKTSTSDDLDIYQINTIGKLTANQESTVINCILKINNSEEFNHPGISNTKINAERFLKYKIARTTVEQTLKDCEVCKWCKNIKYKKNVIFTPLTLSKFSLEHLNTDIMGPIRNKSTPYYIFVTIDRFSRHIWTALKQTMFSTMDINNQKNKNHNTKSIYLTHYNNRPRTTIQEHTMETVMVDQGVKTQIASTHHAETDGLAERAIQTLTKKMRT